jgi:prepilin-type N-terminal cleavage/methylation domain-containing protein/prepilin-type processing-associated H-X9-DG protein
MRSRHRGFTLIELLVVIAVIGTLVALLLPAVQQAREAMRRTECKNRLKQLGLALHNYHDSHQVLPSGSIVIGPSFRTFPGWGWATMVLPMVDQGPLYSRLNFDLGNAVGANRDLISQSVPLMRCTSDPAPETLTVEMPGYSDVTFATGNYVGCEGMLSKLSDVRFGDVTDGLSQTLMLGERLFHPSIDATLPYSSGWCGILSEADTYVFNSSPHVPVSFLTAINHVTASPGNFSSQHSGGANFTLGDGSVRFISQHTDNGVLQALGTISAGDTVGEF